MASRQRSCRRTGVLVAAALVALAALAAPAWAARTQGAPTATAPGPGLPLVDPLSDAHFTVTPLAAPAGSSITFSGDRCWWKGKSGVGFVTMERTDPPGGVRPLALPLAPADDGGNWTQTVTMSPDMAPGRYLVRGYCTGDAAWAYDPAVHVVLGDQTPQVQVSKTTLVRGESFTVSGEACLVDGNPAKVNVLDVFRGADQLRRTWAAAGPDGSWSTEVVVPDDAKLGPSPIGAHCLGTTDGSNIAVVYLPVTVTVVESPGPPGSTTTTTAPGPGPAPPAPPVEATPTYTG